MSTDRITIEELKGGEWIVTEVPVYSVHWYEFIDGNLIDQGEVPFPYDGDGVPYRGTRKQAAAAALRWTKQYRDGAHPKRQPPVYKPVLVKP